MTLLDHAGFDDSRLPPRFTASGANGYMSWPTGRTGVGKAMQRASNPYANQQTIQYSLAASKTTLICGFGYSYFGTGIGSCPTGTPLVVFREGSTVHVTVGFNASGYLQVRGPAGAVLATYTELVNFSFWQHLDIKVTIHDTTGAFQMKVNGKEVFNLSGIDTRNAATGVIDNIVWQSDGANYAGQAVDDFYIADTAGAAPHNDRLGDCVVEMLYPNGNGDQSEFVGSDGNSVDNYLLVDDTSTTDYVGTATLGARDLYQITNGSATLLNVYGVKTNIVATKSDTGSPPGGLAVVLKGDGGAVVSDVVVSAAALNTAAQWFSTAPRQVDPDGDAWTLTNFNALQVGVEVSA